VLRNIQASLLVPRRDTQHAKEVEDGEEGDHHGGHPANDDKNADDLPNAGSTSWSAKACYKHINSVECYATSPQGNYWDTVVTAHTTVNAAVAALQGVADE
jgi:hypothetical protein